MYKSLVLKHVTEPSMLLFASFQATIASLCVLAVSLVVSCVLFDVSMVIAFLFSLAVFIVFHGCMIWMSYKDPYFVNVIISKIRCRKTKNLIPTKDNLYGA